jgi:hypothetical protein
MDLSNRPRQHHEIQAVVGHWAHSEVRTFDLRNEPLVLIC